MAIRTLELIRTGSGFRIALNAKKFKIRNEQTFSELESIVEKLLDLIAVTPPDDWATLMTSDQFKNDLPELGNRRGNLELLPVADDSNDQVILARCSISFRFWPFGGWVVHNGLRFRNDSVSRLTDEELSQWW